MAEDNVGRTDRDGENSVPSFPDIGEFDKRELTIDETSFRFEKMLPVEGYYVLEMIRKSIGSVINKVSAESNIAAIIGTVIAELPEESVEKIRKKMFAHVTFSNRLTKGTWRPVVNDESMAFVDLDPVHVYEILVRSLAVNFTKSFRVVMSRMGQKVPDLPSQNTPT